MPQALPIPLPYPRIFGPSVARHGDVASAPALDGRLAGSPWNAGPRALPRQACLQACWKCTDG